MPLSDWLGLCLQAVDVDQPTRPSSSLHLSVPTAKLWLAGQLNWGHTQALLSVTKLSRYGIQRGASPIPILQAGTRRFRKQRASESQASRSSLWATPLHMASKGPTPWTSCFNTDPHPGLSWSEACTRHNHVSPHQSLDGPGPQRCQHTGEVHWASRTAHVKAPWAHLPSALSLVRWEVRPRERQHCAQRHTGQSLLPHPDAKGREEARRVGASSAPAPARREEQSCLPAH